jgi:hypothetical protein
MEWIISNLGTIIVGAIVLGLLVFLLLLWRTVLPLECKWYWKTAAGALAFAVGFKFKIIQLLGGNYFAPELPGWFLLAAALIYVTAFLFLLFVTVADSVLFILTCIRTFRRNIREKKHDFTPLLKKHPLLNKVHAAGLAGAFVLAVIGFRIVLSMLGGTQQLFDSITTLFGILISVLTMLSYVEYSYLSPINVAVSIVMYSSMVLEAGGGTKTHILVFSIYSFICVTRGMFRINKLYTEQQDKQL